MRQNTKPCTLKYAIYITNYMLFQVIENKTEEVTYIKN